MASDIVDRIAAGLEQISSLDFEHQCESMPELLALKADFDDASANGQADLARLSSIRPRMTALTARLAEQLGQRCLGRVRGLATSLANATTLADVEAAEVALAEANRDWDWICALRREYTASPAMRAAGDQIVAGTRRINSLRRYVEVRGAVQALRERVADLEEKLPDDAVALAKDAVTQLNAALDAGFEWSDPDRDALRILRVTCQQAYDDLRQRHEMPITRSVLTEELVGLIISFADRAKRDPHQTVTYFTSAEPSASTGVVPVQAALETAREKLRKGTWEPKLDTYLADAQKLLDANRPREALAELRRWEVLPGLLDERVGFKIPDSWSARIRGVEADIRKKLDKYEEADALLLRARRELQTDPLAAHASWVKASEAFPHMPELQAVLGELQQKARVEGARLVKDLQEALNSEAWTLLDTRFGRLDKLMALDEQLQTEMQAARDRLREIYEHVAPLLPGRPRLGLKEELALLRELQNDLPDQWQGWPKLTSRLATLEARSDVQQMLGEAEQLARPDATVEQLEAVSSACARLLADPPEGLSESDERKLGLTANRLKAWLGFARARDIIAAAEKPPADAESSDPELLDTPDLKVAQQGLTDATGDLGANQAAGARGLRRRLSQLERNDRPALALLNGADAALASPDVARVRELLTQIETQLGLPNSYRAELLQRRQDGQRRLAQLLTAQLASLLTAGRASRYAQVDPAVLQGYQRELAGLPQPFGPAADLLTRLGVAERVATATRLLSAASEGNVAWSEARTAWDLAGQAAGADVELVRYCQSQARRCYREQMLVTARSAGAPGAAEQTLVGIVAEDAFKGDWGLHLTYGRYALRAGQDLLRSQPQTSEDDRAKLLLGRARDALARAATAASTAGADADAVAQIHASQTALASWERLAVAKSAIAQALSGNGGAVRPADCREAARALETASAELAAPECRSLLNTFWTAHRSGARIMLERQFAAPTDVVARVDLLLAIAVLFPDDPAVQAQLRGFVSEALRVTKQEAGEVCFDSSAGHFLERYARQKRGAPPPDIQVATQQLADVDQVRERLGVMLQVLDMVALQFQGGVDLGSLVVERAELDDWREQLQGFGAVQGQVQQLISFGMKDPSKFAVARYILLLGGARSPEHVQVRPAFRDAGHPTYRALVERLSTAAARRDRQERWRFQIETALKYEQCDEPEGLPAPAPKGEEEVVAELRNGLSQPIRHYPLEYALSLMDQMAREEPDDPCGLQGSMVYAESDGTGQVHQSLASIRSAVQRKVEQVRMLRKWLGQFTIGAMPRGATCPGIADWPKAQRQIMELRDRSQEELKQALLECRRVERGDERELYQGAWSLKRAQRELSYDAMVAALREETGDATLCRAAANINAQREGLYAEITRQVVECEALRHDIERRLNEWQVKWEAVQRTWKALLDERRPSSTSRAADAFREAATDFAGICKNWIEFQKILRQANGRGLHHDALQPLNLRY